MEAARMLPRKTRKARNTGKDAIEAMARMPGDTGKDADAL
ncbi:hypothetical protein C4J85_1113 [Pseudomonas sp. R4-34-07]|nr:hypothetical protein C4J88_1124 [Pseudomonas sp. R4-39-08]AZF51614.1 hypothetical protein C4J85_1113 [Pseudomonas sp. R4-34-07]